MPDQLSATPQQQQAPPPIAAAPTNPEYGQHTTATLAGRLRAAHPDGVASDGVAYKDLPDDELTRRLIDKHPVYQNWLKSDELQRLDRGSPQDAGVWNAVKRVTSGIVHMPGQVYDAATKPLQPGEVDSMLSDPSMTPEQREDQRQKMQQDEQSTTGKIAVFLVNTCTISRWFDETEEIPRWAEGAVPLRSDARVHH